MLKLLLNILVFLLDFNINIMLAFYIIGHGDQHDITSGTVKKLDNLAPLVVILSLPFLHFIIYIYILY